MIALCALILVATVVIAVIKGEQRVPKQYRGEKVARLVKTKIDIPDLPEAQTKKMVMIKTVDGWIEETYLD